MKKFTKIATVAVMTMVTAGVFAGCGLKEMCIRDRRISERSRSCIFRRHG